MNIKSALSLLLALMMCLTGAAAAEEAPAAYAPGEALEDFAFTACDGAACTLAEALEGKEAALIVLWATLDDADSAALQEAYDAYQDRVAFIVLAPGDGDALQAYAEAQGLTYPIGQDAAGLANRFAAEELPAAIVTDASGVITAVAAGEALASYAELLEGVLTPTAQGTPVPPAPMGMSNYILRYVDQNGDPVVGLIANICDDSACTPMFTDDSGTIFFQYPSFAYHIQVIRIPEGYEYDLSQESYLEKGGGTYTYVVPKQ